MNGSGQDCMTAQSMQMTCRLLPYPASGLRAELWVLRTTAAARGGTKRGAVFGPAR